MNMFYGFWWFGFALVIFNYIDTENIINFKDTFGLQSDLLPWHWEPQNLLPLRPHIRPDHDFLSQEGDSSVVRKSFNNAYVVVSVDLVLNLVDIANLCIMILLQIWYGSNEVLSFSNSNPFAWLIF